MMMVEMAPISVIAHHHKVPAHCSPPMPDMRVMMMPMVLPVATVGMGASRRANDRQQDADCCCSEHNFLQHEFSSLHELYFAVATTENRREHCVLPSMVDLNSWAVHHFNNHDRRFA
ncbi:MAG: hypothetical protein ABI230_06710 [Aestuariivirga sp.]